MGRLRISCLGVTNTFPRGEVFVTLKHFLRIEVLFSQDLPEKHENWNRGLNLLQKPTKIHFFWKKWKKMKIIEIKNDKSFNFLRRRRLFLFILGGSLSWSPEIPPLPAYNRNMNFLNPLPCRPRGMVVLWLLSVKRELGNRGKEGQKEDVHVLMLERYPPCSLFFS